MSSTGDDDDSGDNGDPDDKYRGPEFDGLEEGGAKEVHDAFLEHRLSGRRVADPAAYARARRQFERLAGAVRTSPRGASPRLDAGYDDSADADEPPADPETGVDDQAEDEES